MIKDVNIVISRETMPITQAGFGLPFILATSKAHPYTLYTDLTSVAADFAVATEEYKMANRVFGQTPRPPALAIGGLNYTGGNTADLVAKLNDIVDEHNDWYFLLCPEQGSAEIAALSNWVDAQAKLYFAATDDVTVLAGLNSDRTAVLVHSAPETYPDAAWVGRCAPELPGSITWKFKTLNGIPATEDGVTAVTAIHQANGNSYVNKLGLNQTSEGKVTSGEFIDIIRGQDFVHARLSENIHRLLFVSPKIPFDNAGISQIVAEVRGVMQLALNQGIIARDDDGNGLFSVSAPRREDVPVNDRANRILRDVRFAYEVAGAVHNVEVRGVISA